MTLIETCVGIQAWIKSCTTTDELLLLYGAIGVLVSPHKFPNVSFYDLEAAHSVLHNEIEKRGLEILSPVE